jgi:PKD repeat protein
MKPSFRTLLIAFFAGLLAFPAAAQDGSQPELPCPTGLNANQELANNPRMRQRYEAQQDLLEAMRRQRPNASHKTQAHHQPYGGGGNAQYVIPVVVHVIHDGGPAKISKKQVRSQFEILNNAYRNRPETNMYSDFGTDNSIEFQLATKDPNGNPTDGIVYHFDTNQVDHARASEDSMKSAYHWDQTQYCNVWLVSNLTAGQGVSIGGYAAFPWYDLDRSGVVLENEAWGYQAGTAQGTNRYNTAAHELGHWLSLFHPFQGNCSGAGTSCNVQGDHTCDLPQISRTYFQQNGPSFLSRSMSTRYNTCDDGTNNQPDKLDYERSYMDYSDNSIQSVLSPDQKQRMVSALNNASYDGLNQLWSASNLQATGVGPHKAPKAFLVAQTHTTLKHQYVQFNHYSEGQPDQFTWKFQGGSPATSTQEFPKVRYDSAGTYDVTLIVENASGVQDTMKRTDYIRVVDSVYSLPFSETFTTPGPNFPDNWLVRNKDDYGQAMSSEWKKTFASSADQNSGAALIENGYHAAIHEEDALILPPMDCAGYDNVGLRFSRAYVPYAFESSGQSNTVVTDTLSVYASRDGGATWERVYHKGGQELASKNTTTTEILTNPSTGDFMPDSVNLNQFGGDSIRIKFVSKNGWGNHIYVDEIRVDSSNYEVDSVTRRAEPPQLADFALYPNPAQGRANIDLTLRQAASVQVRVLDMQGRQVLRESYGQRTGRQRLQLDLSEQADGLYMIQLQAGQRTYTRKLMKR